MRKIFAIAFPTMFLLLALIISACGWSKAPAQTGATIPGEPVQTAKGTYVNIDVNQLKPLLDDPRFFVVNVHVPYAGEIPGTDAVVPLDQMVTGWFEFTNQGHAPLVINGEPEVETVGGDEGEFPRVTVSFSRRSIETCDALEYS